MVDGLGGEVYEGKGSARQSGQSFRKGSNGSRPADLMARSEGKNE